jgi:phenylpropionate dioxygenase-like ring-hydroxylating dioxygenase large terminal subunit
LTIEIVNHTDQEVAIKNFEKSRYLDDGFVAQEWAYVWSKTWLLAGLASDVANPGDYFVFDIGREQILVTCGSQGDIQSFYNVCQHRGNRLVSDARGQADNFRCAYHAWTYNIDGALAAVPYEARFAEGVPRGDLALKPVQTAVWSGFVFINMSQNPLPLMDFLGPVADMLAPYRFGKMTLVEDQTVHLNCNWKAVVDNFSELYHVDFLHPQHKRMVDCCNDTVHLFDHGHTGLAVPGATVNPRFPVPDVPTDIQSAQLISLGLDPQDYQGRVMEVRKAVQARKREVGQARGFHYEQFEDHQLSDVWQYNLFPNCILSFTPEHLWILRPRPHATDPNRCDFDKISLVMFADPELAQESSEILGPGRVPVSASGFVPEGYKRPGRDVFDHEDILSGAKTMTDTIDQDIELLGQVQAGMASAGFSKTWLNDDEMRIQHFHNYLQTLLAQA